MHRRTATVVRPVIVCSVRDILGGQKSQQRQEETLALVERHFDRVMVHGDPSVIAFERTFPAASRIAGRIEYTGYVVDAAASAAGDAGRDEVIVSAGGGVVGARLLETAIRAKPLSALRDRTWRRFSRPFVGGIAVSVRGPVRR